MIFNLIIYKAVVLSIGVFAATSGLLASDVRQLVVGKSAIVEQVWTAQDLSKMAKTKQLEAAVSRLTVAEYLLEAPDLEIEK